MISKKLGRRGRKSFARFAAFTMATTALCQASPATAQSVPSNFTTGYRYDNAGRLIGTISPGVLLKNADGTQSVHYAAIRLTIDARGLVTRTEDGDLSAWQSEAIAPSGWSGFTVFRQTDYLYDGMGRETQETVSAGGSALAATQYQYDADGRLQCTAIRMNSAVFSALPGSACSPSATGSQGADRITYQAYDQYDHVTQIIRGYGTSAQQNYVTYTLTAWGAPLTITDARNNLASMSYDVFGRLSQWTFPSKTTTGQVDATDYESYSYDAADNIVIRRLRNGTQITYAFDALDRLQTKTLPAGNPNLNSAYDYDLLGRLISMTSSNSIYNTATSYGYDGLGYLISEAENLNGTTHTITSVYDLDGNRKKRSWADATFYTTFGYDSLDRMTDINEGDTTNLVHLDYNAQGRRSVATRANGTSSVYSYDGLLRLSDLKLQAGNSVLNEYTLTYNPASQITRRTISNGAYAWTGAVATNRAYTVNGQNQYTGITGLATITYDVKGNLTSAPTSQNTSTYAYNAENELATQDSSRYYYDPHHRLMFGTLNGFWMLYDGEHLAAEYSRGGVTTTRRYVFGPDGDEPLIWYDGSASSSKRWLAADPLGSIVSVADNTGSALAINTYDEYGITASSNDTYGGRFRYTGQQWIPELGMYYYKARIYSPYLGRFLQTDPVGYGDEINLYTYTGNDPVNGKDPSGDTCKRVGGEYNCQIDTVTTFVHGKTVTRKATDADHQKYHDVEQSLTRAVNAAAAKGSSMEHISFKANGKTYSFDMRAGDIAQAYAQRTINADPTGRVGPGAMNTPNNHLTNVEPRGLNPGGRTTWGSPDRTRQIEFLHDGMHGSKEEAKALGKKLRELGLEPMNTAHQKPYNDAAKDIIGSEVQ